MVIEKDCFFIQHIDAIEQRKQELFQSAREVPWQQSQLVMDCLKELQMALEQLQVAEEELHQQNQELGASRLLAEAEQRRYQQLFEFAPDGYLVTDLYGIVQEANKAASALFKIPQHFLSGKPLISFVPEEHRRGFRALLNQLSIIERIQEWEIPLQKRQHGLFDAAITVETVRDGNHEAIALRWMIRDVTLRKQAEERLRQSQLENLRLVEADRLKNQFLSTLSHELRTPMNAILGFSELLLRQFQRRQDTQLIEMVERIVRNGKNLMVMIEEMLDFARWKSNHLDLNPETFDLIELTYATVDELRSLADHKALEMHVHHSEPALFIFNDRTRLRQILTNLISNAIKFTDVGSIAVEIRQPSQGWFSIIVSDTGIGIASADQAHIFREFWQVNSTTTRRSGGTGLGLAIVHAFVTLMQGRITVESQVGMGTTFQVNLPCQIAQNPHA